MAGGSVCGKIVSIAMFNELGEKSVIKSESSAEVQSAILDLARGNCSLLLTLDNDATVQFGKDLSVEFGPKCQFKRKMFIARARLFRMKDDGFPSRSNEASAEVAANSTAIDEIKKVLITFTEFRARINLLLVCEGGPEIDIYPSLKPEIPALGEQGSENFNYSAQSNWDMSLGIWPMLEEWLGITVAGETKNCSHCGGKGKFESILPKSRFPALDWLSVDGEICNSCRGTGKSRN